MEFIVTPPADGNTPPATSAGRPASTTARAWTLLATPLESADQLEFVLSQRATRFAATPPALRNRPPAYRAGPPPSSKTARARASKPSPVPSAHQLEPSQRAMCFAAPPPATM